ncbi:MAG TPA: FHA domain-containing protein [Bryobacteraceae bacterium]|nr:FHA domain-containing protein [Bryobacteraceae bacterium]
MNFFSGIEKSIERGFRHWTERVFGPADSDQLLLVHRAILEEIETKIQTGARGRRVFPYARLTVTLAAADADKRALYMTAFAEGQRLENDVREALESARCEAPRGFSLEVKTAETGPRTFQIEYEREPRAAAAAPIAVAKLVVVRGKAGRTEYQLTRPRANIGRMAELVDAGQRVVRRNDVVFEEGADDANATVSRGHAHIRCEGGEYRICDDESEYGTRVFRDGRSIEVPKGNRRGEKLRPGDEIYLGRACLRFEQG